MRKPLSLLLAALALGAAVAGCGSSRAAGVITAPSSGATADSTTATVSASTTAAADLTPKSGPLSTQPTIAKPSGAAPTKLVKKNLVTGTGATATATSTITINYVGELYKTGKIFDDHTWTDHENSTEPLTDFIPGFSEGIVGMKVGGRREIIIPPALAYKSAGEAQAGIPANAPLIFVIDLLKVTQ